MHGKKFSLTLLATAILGVCSSVIKTQESQVTAATTSYASFVAKKYRGSYYAYMGATADIWYKLMVNKTSVTWSYVKKNGKQATVYSYNSTTKKWSKATNHGTLWTKKTLGYKDNATKWGATFNKDSVASVSYVKASGKYYYALSYPFFKLSTVMLASHKYTTLVETTVKTTMANLKKYTTTSQTFVKNKRLRRLVGKNYTKKQIAADLKLNAHYTTPNKLRGTWYTYMSSKKWLVVKISERSYTSYVLKNGKKTNQTTIIPGNSGTLKLWVVKHKSGRRMYYTFSKAKVSNSRYLGRMFTYKLNLNKKKQTTLIISLKSRKNMVFTHHKYKKSFNFISKHDLLN